MFSFLKDSAGVQDSPKLQAHAEKVFGMVSLIQHICNSTSINFLFFFVVYTFSVNVTFKIDNYEIKGP